MKHDEIGSGEGPKAPNNEQMRRRRFRKLSGIERIAIGDLAFVLYQACEKGFDAALLRRELVAWRARYL